MRINKFAITVCLILLFSTFMPAFTVSSLDVDNTDRDSNDSENSDGFIIKFKAKSLYLFANDLKNKLSNSELSKKLNEYKNKLLELHENAKNKILEILGCNCLLTGEFKNVFNGLAVRNIPERAVKAIESLSFVEGVYPNHVFKISVQDSVPLINADDVWSIQNDTGINVTGEGVKVAVIDSGIDYTHSVFGGGFGPGYQVVDGYDFVRCSYFNPGTLTCESYKSEDSDPMDDNGHGTHCAGIITAVAPNVTLYAYKVLNSQGFGNEAWIYDALDRVIDPNQDGDFSDHMDVVSMSFGLFDSDNPNENPSNPDDLLSKTVDSLVDSGIVFVAAAGNGGPESKTIESPSSARKAISVGATTKNDKITSYSARGPTAIGTIKPDVVAPGHDIRSTWLNNSYRNEFGTSFACPHVAGVAALILQMHPDWTPLEVKMAIRNTAEDLGYTYTTQGWGRVDALAAVTLNEAPPIAFLNTSGSFDNDINQIDIYGTASAREFQDYKLFYKKEGLWIKIHESTSPVSYGKLFNWDVSSVQKDKTFYLKLEVNSLSQTSIDLVLITLGNLSDIDYTTIKVNKTVKELEEFNVKIFDDNYDPMNAFVLFYTPRHIPRIKYGSDLNFKAPKIYLPSVESIGSKIIVLKLIDKTIIKTDITILNSN